MSIAKFIDSFLHKDRFADDAALRRSRLFVRASLLTSLFSNSYIWLSVFFEYSLGIYLMIFNVVGFLILSLLAKTKLSMDLLGNLYVFFGATAVIVLTYFSGGMWSAIYPWIISVPVLALLVVDRKSGIIWACIAFLAMLYFGIREVQGVDFPVLYNESMKSEWFLTVLPGLLLIIMVVSLVFEGTQKRALREVEEKNRVLKKQKETIAKQSLELKQMIEDKDQIIRILAHDLKNPLANITTISYLLKTEGNEVEKAKLVDMIEQVSSKAQNLIAKVLETAIQEQGSLSLHLEIVDTGKALEEALESMSELARNKKIEIELLNEADKSLVNADRTYLLLIFENLISNAVKFSSAGSKVLTRITNSENSVQVSVMDNGPGVAEEEEGKLFEKFSKLSARPTANESSTGIGLSLVKHYAEQLGGSVWYDKHASKGATFVVGLPAL